MVKQKNCQATALPRRYGNQDWCQNNRHRAMGEQWTVLTLESERALRVLPDSRQPRRVSAGFRNEWGGCGTGGSAGAPAEGQARLALQRLPTRYPLSLPRLDSLGMPFCSNP